MNMFPAQTSLIPATLSLLRFFNEKGMSSFWQNYPYWYLGSTPFRFLIGPIVPVITDLMPLRDILIYLIVGSFVLSAVGWGIFVKKTSKSKLFACLVVLFYLVLPGKYYLGLGLEEATFTIARNLLPFFFIFIYQKKKLLSILFLCFLLLINTSILTQVFVGMTAISLNFVRFKKNLFLVLICLFLVTLWYTPSYWLTAFFNPSIGGLTAGKLFLRIFELARSITPLLLAFFVVRLGKEKRSPLYKFGLIWLGIFTFLTLYRFIADYDFWADWTAWLPEIEIGSIILALSFIRDKKYKYLFLPILITVMPTLIIMNKIKFNTLVSKNPPKIVQSIIELQKVSGGSNVFLSGTSVFWTNVFTNVIQVRGGRDQFATHPFWDKASFEFREGNDIKKTKGWLEKLNIDYVLVNTEDSSDYYRDFKTISKWRSIGRIVWQGDGNLIISYK